jgi:hypothetical protein
MKFEEYQREWQTVQSEPKTHDELCKMMYAPRAWRLRGFMRKEISSLMGELLTFASGFLLTGWSWRWTDFLYVIWFIIFILYNHLGLRYLSRLPQKGTLKKTLISALTRVKRLAIISRVMLYLLWILLAIILGMRVYVGTMNMIRWALMLLPLLAAVMWWNSRTWARRGDEVKELLKEFDEEPIAAV